MTGAQSAESTRTLSKIDKTRFCVAFFVFSFAWMLALQIVAAVLLPAAFGRYRARQQRRHLWCA